MALTNTQLRALLKANLHNDAGFSDPTDLDTFLTLGQERIIIDAPETMGPKQGTISLTVAAGRSYDLASDFFRMRGIYYPSSGVWLEPIGAAEWIETVETQDTIPSGEPDQYTLQWNSTTGLWKVIFNYTPADSYTYYYWYFPMPAAISGSSTASISSMGFSQLLIEAATMIAQERNDPEAAAIAAEHYSRLIHEFRNYNPMGADYVPIQRPGISRQPQNQLGPHFPAEW